MEGSIWQLSLGILKDFPLRSVTVNYSELATILLLVYKFLALQSSLLQHREKGYR